MKKYRIKEHTYPNYQEYEVQKKFLNLFWYNPTNIDANTTGFYNTLKEAESIIEFWISSTESKTTKIVKTYNV